MGYVTSEAGDQGRTVCGECHNSKQNAWVLTAHADAWNGLQSSGSAQEFCEGCHTDNQQGSTSTIEGGWLTTADTRYYDVQCENCHGPGETHANNPESSNIPLAPLTVGSDIDLGCGECHSGSHHPYVEQWEASPHSHIVGFASTRDGCNTCHSGQATLVTWGENANYLEKFDDPLPVVCGVCHDPHGEAVFEGQLRFPANTSELEGQLCARCHNRRPEPDPGSSHGLHPHAPESMLLVGSAGWFPPGSDIGKGEIRATHGTENNERFCASCHVVFMEIDDPVSGEFVLESVGHHFNPIPCTDAQGIPMGFPNECSLAERSYVGCVDSGCHSSEATAASALTAASARMNFLVEVLHDLLVIVDPNGEDPGGEIDATNPTFTVAEGAFFNMALAEFGSDEWGTHSVLGSSTHNPFLIESLLIASIEAVEDEYAGILPRVSGIDWNAELQRVMEEYAVQ
jgi:hypothetical protein